MDQLFKQEFVNLILNGYHNAQSAHSTIFNIEGPKENYVITAYLAIANSHINAAKAVYICNMELSRKEYDEFFSEFKSFSDEVMANISTIEVKGNIGKDYRHQWSDIHFPKLKEAYEPVASLLKDLK
ncbi:MAG TPA: hypothetical protein VN374_07070 [Desulfitobacteriaceae bacterium]|nr:hypothetical protein [Desulfitobacteriaceae bacterium]